MAKFTGKNLTATFGGVALSCITSLESNQAVDVYTASCAGDDYKSRAIGLTDASFTLNLVLDTTTHAAELAALEPGSTGAFTSSTNGTLGPQYNAAAAYIESLNVSAPVEGFVSATATVGVDGALVTA